jgi:uncharacterized protein (DUF302 family)
MTRACPAWLKLFPLVVFWAIIAPGQQSIAAETEGEFVGPYPGTVSWQTDFGLHELVARVQKAVGANGLAVVYTQFTTGKTGGPRTALVLVSGKGLAERMIAAEPLAGMEAPIRLWIVEHEDHRASLIYRTPTSILAIYDNGDLDSLGAELDQVFAKIVEESIGN